MVLRKTVSYFCTLHSCLAVFHTSITGIAVWYIQVWLREHHLNRHLINCLLFLSSSSLKLFRRMKILKCKFKTCLFGTTL